MSNPWTYVHIMMSVHGEIPVIFVMCNMLLLIAFIILLILIIDNVCIALFSGVHKLPALYNILQHFLSFTNTYNYDN